MAGKPRKTTSARTPRRKAAPAPEVRLFGRDESWLAFNGRVLQEAQDTKNPLLERVKFLAITASNLDEFWEIRVASILQKLEDGQNDIGPEGLTLSQTMERLKGQLAEFNVAQYACWNKLLDDLGRHGIHICDWDELSHEDRVFAKRYYEAEIDPLLTPVTIDPAHPFPRVLNKALCVALLLRRKRKGSQTLLGVVTVPRSLPRLIKLPSEGPRSNYIFLHDLIEQSSPSLYRGYEVLATAAFRVTRNSNLYMQEEEQRSVLESVRAELHNRRKGDAVRLEIDSDAHPDIIELLRTNFELDPWQVYSSDGPVNLNRLMNLYSEPRPELKFHSFTPREFKLHRNSPDIFAEILRNDILLHHPFDSYETVTAFIESAAEDERIVSIKQTLYRTSDDSSIFQGLVDAAASTEVTVVVELMARFDEASNIRWARKLEDAGVQVFHGILGLKTHCKLALIVRRDPDGVTRSYAHLATGNYNPITARFYTDLSLLTADTAITNAVHGVFNYLTADAERKSYSPLQVAPLTLAAEQLALIERESAHARAGRPARIIAKMNSLLEVTIIEALYRSSQCGVKIDLIVRGICALRPGVKGMSENIRVRSVVGRYLEHSRIYCFANGGQEEIYCGSADWMPRNLFERCETIFPIKDAKLHERIRHEILDAYLADNQKARLLQPDGSYERVPVVGEPFCAQEFLMQVAEGRADASMIGKPHKQRPGETSRQNSAEQVRPGAPANPSAHGSARAAAADVKASAEAEAAELQPA